MVLLQEKELEEEMVGITLAFLQPDCEVAYNRVLSEYWSPLPSLMVP